MTGFDTSMRLGPPPIEASMKRLVAVLLVVINMMAAADSPSFAGDIEYPQLIRTRYEAADPKTGGNFVIWSEREKISYGLDPRLYPAAQYVEITQVTPSQGSITLAFVEVKTVSSQTPDYIYLTGNLRFRVTGMILKSSNFPAGHGMEPAK
jgi:hypothetical protein